MLDLIQELEVRIRPAPAESRANHRFLGGDRPSKKRGVSRPDTFVFLGFTFICSKEISPIAGSVPIVYIREGSRRDELLALIEEEPSISILVLAAGTGPKGPGPLIFYLTDKPAARLCLPITIVPGRLTMEELDAVS